MKKSVQYLANKKKKHEKITMLSCYDYPTTLWAENAGIDIVLVGDSLGVKMLGYDKPDQVTMEDMIHHFKAVHRGISEAFLIADLPLSSCRSIKQALEDSNRFVDHGADAVKIEGFDLKIVEHLLNNQIKVCFDIIYPLFKHQFNSPNKDNIQIIIEIIKTALELGKSGVSLIVFTLFPEEATKIVSELLKIPVIGVGSGRYTDGQVLIAAEMLGTNEAFGNGIYNYKYEEFAKKGQNAFRKFAQDTMKGKFPKEGNYTNLDMAQYNEIKVAINRN